MVLFCLRFSRITLYLQTFVALIPAAELPLTLCYTLWLCLFDQGLDVVWNWNELLKHFGLVINVGLVVWLETLICRSWIRHEGGVLLWTQIATNGCVPRVGATLAHCLLWLTEVSSYVLFVDVWIILWWEFRLALLFLFADPYVNNQLAKSAFVWVLTLFGFLDVSNALPAVSWFRFRRLMTCCRTAILLTLLFALKVKVQDVI